MAVMKLTGDFCKDLAELRKIYNRGIEEEVKVGLEEFRENLKTSTDKKIGSGRITLRNLYVVYTGWCRDNEFTPLGRNLFSEWVSSEISPCVTLGGNWRGFHGIYLNEELEWYLED